MKASAGPQDRQLHLLWERTTVDLVQVVTGRGSYRSSVSRSLRETLLTRRASAYRYDKQGLCEQ
jgi:hypothetical protein